MPDLTTLLSKFLVDLYAGTLPGGGGGVGGSGGAYFQVAGPTVNRTYTLPDSNATLATLGAAQTFTGLQTFSGGLALTGILTTAVNAIAQTSTDGLVLANTTAATVGVPVQYSPRLRLRANVYNVTGGIANTDDWWLESQPFSQAAPYQVLQFIGSKNGGAPTVAMSLGGQIYTLTVPGGFVAGATATLLFSGRSNLGSSAAAKFEFYNSSFSIGVGIDAATDGVLKVRTKAQSAYAPVDALGYRASGVAGVTFGPAAVTSITIVGGIVTACA